MIKDITTDWPTFFYPHIQFSIGNTGNSFFFCYCSTGVEKLMERWKQNATKCIEQPWWINHDEHGAHDLEVVWASTAEDENVRPVWSDEGTVTHRNYSVRSIQTTWVHAPSSSAIGLMVPNQKISTNLCNIDINMFRLIFFHRLWKICLKFVLFDGNSTLDTSDIYIFIY